MSKLHVFVSAALVFADDVKVMEKKKKKKDKRKKKKKKDKSRSRSREAAKPSTSDQPVFRDALPLVQVKSEFPEDTGNFGSGSRAERHFAGQKNDFRVKTEKDKRREVSSSDNLYHHRRSCSPLRRDKDERHDSRSFAAVDGRQSKLKLKEGNRSGAVKTEEKDLEAGSSSKHGSLRISRLCDQRDGLKKRRRRSSSSGDSNDRQRLHTDKNSRDVERNQNHQRNKSAECRDDGQKRHKRSSSASSSDSHGRTHRHERDRNRDRSAHHEHRNDNNDRDSHEHRYHNAR